MCQWCAAFQASRGITVYTVLTIEKPVLVPCMPLLCGRNDEDIPMALGVTVLGLRTIGMWGLLSRAGFDAPTICNGGVDVYPLQYRAQHARCCSRSECYICAEGPAVAAGGSTTGRRLGRELVAESGGRESTTGGAGPLRQIRGAHSTAKGLLGGVVTRL